MTRRYTRIPTVPANTDGRDFVVGDIHGRFRTLERALPERQFDAARDQLFGVGFTYEWERYRLTSAIVETIRRRRPLDRSCGQTGEAEIPSMECPPQTHLR